MRTHKSVCIVLSTRPVLCATSDIVLQTANKFRASVHFQFAVTYIALAIITDILVLADRCEGCGLSRSVEVGWRFGRVVVTRVVLGVDSLDFVRLPTGDFFCDGRVWCW
jgi:hypothetical protein